MYRGPIPLLGKVTLNEKGSSIRKFSLYLGFQCVGVFNVQRYSMYRGVQCIEGIQCTELFNVQKCTNVQRCSIWQVSL